MTIGSRRVTVIIPLYNHEKYIARAVESILAQGEILRDIIVIDDGSKDSSANVVQTIAENDSRITLIRQENRGAHATINRGLQIAQGEFVTILNSDDYFAEGRFAALARSLDLDQGSDFASSSIDFVDGNGASIHNPWFDAALNAFKKRRDVAISLLDANYLMTTSNFFLRRVILDKLGLFAPLRYAHDLEFALRCVNNDIRFCYIDRPLMSYRFHAHNTISENHDKVRIEWALCAALYIRNMQIHSRDNTTLINHRLMELTTIFERHNLNRAVSILLQILNDKSIDKIDDHFVSHFLPTELSMMLV